MNSPFQLFVRHGACGRIQSAVLAVATAALLVSGCTAPIGAERVTIRQAYAHSQANALRSGDFSSHTVVVLHRYGLRDLATQHPDQAVRELHQKALACGERDLLFTLAELSYVAGDDIRSSLKPWEPRDGRDYYLGAAVYAWLYLFGEGNEPQPSPFDRRFRDSCDLYNDALARSLGQRRGTNAVVTLESGPRRLPVGQIDLQLDLSHFPARLEEFEEILSGDQFRV